MASAEPQESRGRWTQPRSRCMLVFIVLALLTVALVVWLSSLNGNYF